MKKKRFTNNWKVYRDIPDDAFPTVPFDEFMEWRVFGWEILPTHCCIIRATSITGKVKEYSYKRTTAADRRLDKLMDDVNMTEIVIANDDEVQLIQRSKEYE